MVKSLVKSLFDEVVHKTRAVIIYKDIQSTIKLAIDDQNGSSKRTKHIDVRHHYVKDAIQKQIIKLIYVETGRQIVDMMKKALNFIKLNELVKIINLK